MAGGGDPPGTPGGGPPSCGGGGRGAASAGTGSTEPGDVVQHRHLLRAEPGHVPVVASATAAGRHRRRRPGPYRSETRGREPSLTGYREDLCVACDGPGHRAGTAAHVCASREGPRAARGRAGGGSRRESSCVRSVGGRECAVGGEPGGGRVRPCRLRTCSGTESSVPIARGRGQPVSACSRRVRRTASSGWLPWSRYSIGQARERLSRRRRAGPYGNELQEEPGDLARRAGAGEPRAGLDSGSPRARTSPVGTPDPGDCGGQPVARERSGRPLGLTPGTATAPRGTGGIHRGPAGAGSR
jgi:hypothetical protein